jgi:site-specific recombinase XerD
MAKVYTGKVVIPGDKMDEYFKLMQEAEERREPFRCSLLELKQGFYEHVLAKYSERTARKHASVIDLFIEFISRQTDVESIEEITRGMVNTYFKQWCRRKVWGAPSPDQLRVSLKKFFSFLATEKGIVNEKVLKSLR